MAKHAKAKHAKPVKPAKQKAPHADHDLGIHTTRPVPLEGLDIDGDNAVHGNRYEPTPYGILDDMLLELGFDAEDYARFAFVDLGSGKGRILCLAAAHPFRRVLGVEFSRELHAIAQENLTALPASWKKTREVRSIRADAACFTLPEEPLLLFLFNPFNVPVLARVIENVERSFAANPREIYLLYYMPVHETELERSRALRPVRITYDWVIYKTEA